MESLEAVKKLIDHFGSQAKAAKALGIEQPNISNWLRGKNRVSAVLALRAELATGGAVKAVDLCPKLAGLHDAQPESEEVRKAS